MPAETPAAAKGDTDAAAAAAAAAAAGTGTPTPGTGEQPKPGAAESGQPPVAAKTGETPAGPPDKYTLAIPDEAKTYIDDADVKRLESIARETGWTNEEAQAAVDEHVRMVAEAAAGFLAETKADPTYGGEHLAETQRLAKLVIDSVRPEGHARRESFTRFINKVGASNHLDVVSFLADIGKRMDEDRPGQTSSSALRGVKSAESVLYDKTPSS